MNKNFDIVVLGSCIIDFICYLERFPKVGETIFGTKFKTGFGGKGANSCIAAAKLGSRTVMIGKLGDDSWGNDYKDNLNKENVCTNYIELVKNQSTGIAQINVASNGDNQIVIVVGANNCLCVKDILTAKDTIMNSKVLLCQLETNIEATIEALKTFKGTSILNAAPAMSNLPKELLQLPTIFCVNETEASLITGIEVTNLEDTKGAILLLLSMGCNNIVIITLGKLGAVFASKSDPRPVHVIAPQHVTVIDTTGAGDCFIGALANSLASETELAIPFHQKIGRACEIASMSCQNEGTQSSFPTLNDFVNKKAVEGTREEYKWKYL